MVASCSNEVNNVQVFVRSLNSSVCKVGWRRETGFHIRGNI